MTMPTTTPAVSAVFITLSNEGGGPDWTDFDALGTCEGCEAPATVVDGHHTTCEECWQEMCEDRIEAKSARVAKGHLDGIDWEPTQGVSDAALGLADKAWGSMPDVPYLTQARWNAACVRAVRLLSQAQLEAAQSSGRV